MLSQKETIHIVALNDIALQMEEQEILSWKKLANEDGEGDLLKLVLAVQGGT